MFAPGKQRTVVIVLTVKVGINFCFLTSNRIGKLVGNTMQFTWIHILLFIVHVGQNARARSSMITYSEILVVIARLWIYEGSSEQGGIRKIGK